MLQEEKFNIISLIESLLPSELTTIKMIELLLPLELMIIAMIELLLQQELLVIISKFKILIHKSGKSLRIEISCHNLRV